MPPNCGGVLKELRSTPTCEDGGIELRYSVAGVVRGGAIVGGYIGGCGGGSSGCVIARVR